MDVFAKWEEGTEVGGSFHRPNQPKSNGLFRARGTQQQDLRATLISDDETTGLR